MADGCHIGKIEKSPYLNNGLSDCHEIWHDDAHLPTHPPYRLLKMRTFENPRLRTAAILKIEKKPLYCGFVVNVLSIITKFGTMTH